MSRSKRQSSGDIAGTANKCQVVTMELEAQRKDKETRGRSNWRTEEIHDTGNGKGIFFTWGSTVSFWGTGPEHRTVHESCSSRSESNPVLPCHLWLEKKSYYPDITGLFFQEDRWNWNQQGTRTCAINVRWVKLQLALCLLLLTVLQLYHLPPPLRPPVTLLVNSMPAPVCQLLYCTYCTFQGTVL